jgi:hypothetical protein
MSLAETLGARTRGLPAYVEPRPRWFDDFAVEDICVAEPQEAIELVPIPLPVDSKRLFLASAKLPHSDRLQVNFTRLVRNFCAHMVAWHEVGHIGLAHHKPDIWFDIHQVRHHVSAPMPEKDVVISKSAKLLSEISGRPEDELVALIRLLVSNLTSRAEATNVEEKVLETFVGYVDNVEGDTAYVRLKSREHGDTLYGQYSASELASKGIYEQTRFLCETIKIGETTRLDLKALPDVEVSEEELRAIEEKIDRVIPRDDPGIEY